MATLTQDLHSPAPDTIFHDVASERPLFFGKPAANQEPPQLCDTDRQLIAIPGLDDLYPAPRKANNYFSSLIRIFRHATSNGPLPAPMP